MAKNVNFLVKGPLRNLGPPLLGEAPLFENLQYKHVEKHLSFVQEQVAVKKVRDVKETDIRHLRKLNHPNIINFK